MNLILEFTDNFLVDKLVTQLLAHKKRMGNNVDGNELARIIMDSTRS